MLVLFILLIYFNSKDASIRIKVTEFRNSIEGTVALFGYWTF